eukprot:NODE_842_length_1416_cov_162.340161_g699_i0.p1 GENE.NODE_842_length_1416_cov_162.340161_g699_i0~~NODE_842_length_1416_cov_162.340161_g699_i0.p1  ORF type:complete len:360 (-),score=69.10 NODE_842_length_1416_cov_162.340161_g699_i0:337-1326(-)
MKYVVEAFNVQDLISSEYVYSYLKNDNDPNIVMPNNLVRMNQTKTLVVGNQTIQLTASITCNHGFGSLIMHLPNTRFTMRADVGSPFVVAYSQLNYSRQGCRASQYKPEISETLRVIGDAPDALHGSGHRYVTNRTSAELLMNYWDDLVAAVKKYNVPATFAEAATSMGLNSETSPGYGNLYLRFRTAFEMITRRCADDLYQKYSKVMASVDVFSQENCYAYLLEITFDVCFARRKRSPPPFRPTNPCNRSLLSRCMPPPTSVPTAVPAPREDLAVVYGCRKSTATCCTWSTIFGGSVSMARPICTYTPTLTVRHPEAGMARPQPPPAT